MLEGKCRRDGPATDESLLAQAIETLAERIGMTSLGVLAVKVPVELELTHGRPPFADESGVTVVMVLSTSHIACHTWPEFGMVHLDVFSCREFSEEVVLDWCVDALGLEDFTAKSWRR